MTLRIIYSICLLAMMTMARAGVEKNLVIVKPTRPITGTVYGVWLRDGLIITEGQAIKPDTPVNVTFYKGQKKEFSVKATPVRISGIAYLKPEKGTHTFPEGFTISTTKLFNEGDAVEMWDYLNEFSCLETEIDTWTTNRRANNHLFGLPGYISDAHGIPVTHDEKTLVGVVINTNGRYLGISSASIAEAVEGMLTKTSVTFVNLSEKGYEYNISASTFDPFNKITSIGFIHRVCPYYANRGFTKSGHITFDKPGDGKQMIVPMVKDPDGTYRCTLTVPIPTEKTWYWGLYALTADGKPKRPFQVLLPDHSTRLYGLDFFVKEGRAPYQLGAKHPKGKDLSATAAPKTPKDYPAVSFQTIKPESLFPLAVGNEWTYHREQHETNTSIYSGRFRILTNSKNRNTIQQRVNRSRSSQNETYRIDRMVGDRAWLKVYCAEEKSPGVIRDGRYENASELMLQWVWVNNNVLVLEENALIPSKNGTQLSKCDLLVIDTKGLKKDGSSKMSSMMSKDYSFKWRIHNAPIKTPVGTFANSVVATEKGALFEGYRYELRTFYYPGVGMIKEEYDLLVPSRSGGKLIHSPIRSHELVLKSFSVN